MQYVFCIFVPCILRFEMGEGGSNVGLLKCWLFFLDFYSFVVEKKSSIEIIRTSNFIDRRRTSQK